MFLTAQVSERRVLRRNSPSTPRFSLPPLSDTLGPVTPPGPARRYRFGIFEADTSTGELRRRGLRVRLNAQPFHVLCLLLNRPGELLTREEIAQQLWPDGTFVDYDHGVHSAVNRIREAIGDSANSPRFIETLARRGYRFIAPVECIEPEVGPTTASEGQPLPADDAFGIGIGSASVPQPDPGAPSATRWRILATPRDLPQVPRRLAETLFLLLQGMYLAFYIGALANLAEISDLFSPLPHPRFLLTLLILTAAVLIPVRAFVLCAVLFHAPDVRSKILRLWVPLLLLDELWSLSPFLLLHHINTGLALAATALLVYSPFAQRSLVLMGAGEPVRTG